MAENETGWTKGLPGLDGDYYSRVDEFDKQPTAIRIESRTSDAPAAVYEFGCDKDLRREYEAENYEYLGPFTATDFEQLTRLREAAKSMLGAADDAEAAMNAADIHCPTDLAIALRDRRASLKRSMATLRERLAQRHTAGEKS